PTCPTGPTGTTGGTGPTGPTGSGTVTSITAGFGLTGGAITTSGTIALQSTAGAVGTYAFLDQNFGTYGPGSTIAGSKLKWAMVKETVTGGTIIINNGSSPSGTWQCMGYSAQYCDCGAAGSATLWLRIA
ncbi:MAG: hypothetical protein WCH96_08930, partial [Betaproteobacteria bacterium]